MRKILIAFTLGLAVVVLFGMTTAGREFKTLDGRTWNEEAVFPENVYYKFLNMPKTNVGFIDALLNRSRPQDGNVILMIDIRNNIAVFFFRGVPGGTGFVIPEEWPYRYREYVLEIRWLDEKTGQWRVWWNKDKIDGTFLLRRELLPVAENAPF